MVLTMQDLERCFEKAKGEKARLIGVEIKMEGFKKPEVIINTRENFDEKLAYYQKAYNDDLTLKAFNGIRITCFCYGNSFAEIEDKLCGTGRLASV
jgi:hypothetical protein